MDLRDLIIELDKTEEYICFYSSPRIAMKKDVEGEKQDSGIKGVDHEIVDQKGCGDYGFSGSIAFPFGDGSEYYVLDFDGG